MALLSMHSWNDQAGVISPHRAVNGEPHRQRTDYCTVKYTFLQLLRAGSDFKIWLPLGQVCCLFWIGLLTSLSLQIRAIEVPCNVARKNCV